MTGETANLFIKTTFREHFDKYRLINEKGGIKEALVTPIVKGTITDIMLLWHE